MALPGDITDEAFCTVPQPGGGQTRNKLEMVGASVPMGRPGQPLDLASVDVLLASQNGSGRTGQTCSATGGNVL